MDRIARSDASFFRFADRIYEGCQNAAIRLRASPKVTFRVTFLGVAIVVGYLVLMTLADNLFTELSVQSAKSSFQERHRDLYQALVPLEKGAQGASAYTIEELALAADIYLCIASPRIVEGRKALKTARSEEACSADILRSVAVNSGNARAGEVRALMQKHGFLLAEPLALAR